MKFIIAIIKPEKLDDIRDSLSQIGITGMTVTEVKGFGNQKGHKKSYRGAEYVVEFRKKVKIEIATEEKIAPTVIQTIQRVANTNNIGDGKIFVFPIEQVVRIRTNDRDKNAI